MCTTFWSKAITIVRKLYLSTEKWFFPELVERFSDLIYNVFIIFIEVKLMNDFVKLLDENLECIKYDLDKEKGFCYIYVKSIRQDVKCPFCGGISNKVHSTYQKSFQDLPIQGYKVNILLDNRKMFCLNPECKYTTFAERFYFIENKAKKTKRLEDEIIDLSLNCSSIAASQILKGSIANVSKSTICQLLKKKRDFS